MPYRRAARVVLSSLVAAGALALCGRAAVAGPVAAPAARPGGAATAAALKAEAGALVRSGDIGGARDRYRQALDLAPDDLEARFGYARTSAWMRDYSEAEAAYRAGLGQAPEAVEGLVGLADVLAWTGRYAEALEVLARAERLEPANPDVARRQGRASRRRGDRAGAKAAYRRTLALAPGDAEATRALAELAAETTSSLEVAYTRERLSDAKAARFGTDANTIASLQYTYTGFRQLALLGRITYSDKFGDHEVNQDDFQFAAGAAWRVRPRTTLRAEAAIGPDADTLPAFAGEAELLQGLRLPRGGGVVLGLGYRYLSFNRVVRFFEGGARATADPEATVHIITPSLEWDSPWPLVVFARYYYSITDFEAIAPVAFPGLETGRAGGTDRTSSILLKATLFPDARLAPFVAYARGVESFSTAAQIRGFTTDTYAAGAELRLTRRLGLRGAYEYQDSGRDTAGGRITQQNFSAGAYVRW